MTSHCVFTGNSLLDHRVGGMAGDRRGCLGKVKGGGGLWVTPRDGESDVS